MTTTAWTNPHQLHPWFRMPSLKRKESSDEEDDAPSFYQSRRSLSPAPSPKRRRCDVLESGMSQLTLEGRSIASPAPYGSASVAAGAAFLAPTVQYPDPSPPNSHPLSWTDASYAPRVTHIPLNAAATVVLPGSVEEPTSPETVTEDAAVRDVSMKGPSWYEVEKDRIVITDLEDSDAEDENTPPDAKPASADDAPSFTISSAFLDRLPKPHVLGPLEPEASPSNALVLYRPLQAPEPDESKEETGSEKCRPQKEMGPGSDTGVIEELEPMGEEVPMEDTRPCTPMVLELASVDEPVDEPMDIEML